MHTMIIESENGLVFCECDLLQPLSITVSYVYSRDHRVYTHGSGLRYEKKTHVRKSQSIGTLALHTKVILNI
jgi:hypothetical protein